MSEFESNHAAICGEFLRRSRQYLDDGALLQASEKGWGAAAQAAKVYADARDYAYRSHSHFNHVVNLLAQESGNRMARNGRLAPAHCMRISTRIGWMPK